MAKVVGVDEISEALRGHIAAATRSTDEVLVLPSAYVSAESKLPKNVVFKLDGKARDLSPALFSDQLFAGVSVVTLDAAEVEKLLRLQRSAKRGETLAKLAAAVPSELENPDLTVGPQLDGDARDRDLDDWVPGFDSAACAVGLYTALESTCPLRGKAAPGFARAATSFHLVCRAGAGVAAAQFLTRLTTQLAKGVPLGACLDEGGEPGAAALRRLSKAGERNRARILLLAAEALGLSSAVRSIGDTAAVPGSSARGAVTTATCSINSLRSMDLKGESWFLYASGCCDAAFASGGVVASSGPADGFLLLRAADALAGGKGKTQRVLINEAYSCIPFASQRLQSARKLVVEIADKYRAAALAGRRADSVHPDAAWLRHHFAWNNVSLEDETSAVFDASAYEPLAMWGAFDVDGFLAYARELAIADHTKTRLRPELVAVAGVPPAKLRLISRHASMPNAPPAASAATTPSASGASTPRKHGLPAAPTRVRLGSAATAALKGRGGA
jgi:hypothetical protein